jgi:hypothetical protein
VHYNQPPLHVSLWFACHTLRLGFSARPSSEQTFVRMDQPTPASLVGRWVDTPAHIFRTQRDAYRGNVVSIDSKRAKNVVVIFQDDPTLEYFVPVTSVVEWLVDPRNHHSDDEEL